MKIACISFSNKGNQLGNRLTYLSDKEYKIEHYRSREIEGKVPSFLKKYWDKYDGFIFIGATGIAVRYITPHIKDKREDPAILVIDDLGRFVISLLSGHLGGANHLANHIAKSINAIPVVTTATDGRGIESVDIFAKNNGYYMEDMEDIKNVTSVMVNGGRLGFLSQEDRVIDYDRVVSIDCISKVNKDLDGLLIVSNKTEIEGIKNLKIPVAILRPKNLNIGIGCRRGKETGKIIKAIEDSLKEINRTDKSLKSMGTIEIKKDEIGIIEAAKYFQIPINIFKVDDMVRVEDKFTKSEFVKKTVGVYSVSEPAAYLLGEKMLLEKAVHDGITISISEGGNNE